MHTVTVIVNYNANIMQVRLYLKRECSHWRKNSSKFVLILFLIYLMSTFVLQHFLPEVVSHVMASSSVSVGTEVDTSEDPLYHPEIAMDWKYGRKLTIIEKCYHKFREFVRILFQFGKPYVGRIAHDLVLNRSKIFLIWERQKFITCGSNFIWSRTRVRQVG